MLSLPPAFVLSQDQTLRLKEDHLAYRSSLITGGHCLFFRNFESPKSCSTSDPVEDLGFYRAARNRTAEVFVPLAFPLERQSSAVHVSLSSIINLSKSPNPEIVSASVGDAPHILFSN